MNRLITGSIFVFWLVMMGLLFQKELLPELVLGPTPSYRQVLAVKPGDERVRMGIYLFGWRVGVSDSSTTVGKDGLYLFKNSTKIDLGRLARQLRETWEDRLQVESRSEIEVSPDGRLRRFRMDVDSPIVRAGLFGVMEGEELVFTVSTPEQSVVHRMPYDPEVILATSLNPFVELTDLEVGKKWQVSMLSPRTLELTFATMEVVGEGITRLADEPVEYYQVRTELEGFPLEGWISKQGKLLKVIVAPVEFVREPVRYD